MTPNADSVGHPDPTLPLDDYLAQVGRAHTHCRYCGRSLVDVTEPDTLHDERTGERRPIVWRQCPRYPRHGWQAFYRGSHESFQRDNPVLAREWR